MGRNGKAMSKYKKLTCYSLIIELWSDCIGQKWEGHVETLLYVTYCTSHYKILSYKTNLDELDNSNNFENRSPINTLFTYHVPAYEDFTHFETVVLHIR